MPLYEYECETCGHRFEVIQKFSDAPVETCQKCGGPVHKLMSSPAIQFKGSGWYITDYAKKDNVTATRAGETGKSESPAAAPASTDAASSTSAPASTPAAAPASSSDTKKGS